MLRQFEDFLALLAERHADIERAIRGLPTEALDWSPGLEMNSLAVLVTHTLGAERYWIGDVAMQDPSNRDRAAEFRVRGVDESALLARLQANTDYAREALARLSIEDLAAMRTSPRDGREVTVFWALAHALEHTAQHAGHIQITRQLWDQQW